MFIISAQFITGLMFGLEFDFDEGTTVVLDLGIIRLILVVPSNNGGGHAA